ncbi:hypothetical protein [Lactobacillus sp. PV012]|uniref:hypothetical protein n=1 Tax=unclassified Lactobacillus TaxID=2620435 RepID=UPI003A0FFAB8
MKEYEEILIKLADGELTEYRVEPQKAFSFQETLRKFGRRQEITGKAERGGTILYTKIKSET